MLSLYVLKAVCAILIVFIHLPGIGVEATILQPMMRIGVPAFFMISGFFMVTDGVLDAAKIRKQLNKILTITLQVYAVYIAFIMCRNLLLGNSIINSAWLTPEFIIRWLFVGDNIDSVLWYITAYIEALIILLLLLKFLSCKSVLRILAIAAPMLLSLAVLLNRYSGLLDSVFDIAISRNVLTVALPCLTLGALTNVYRDRLLSFGQIKIVTAICILAAYVEYGALHYWNIKGSGADFNLLTFPSAFCIFLLCVLAPNIKSIPGNISRPLSYIGKNCSGDIYLYHSLIWQVLSLIIILSGVSQLDIFANAESVILIVLTASFLKHNLKNRAWILVR